MRGMNDQCVVRLIPGPVPVLETVYVGVVRRADLERLARETFEQAVAHGTTLLLSNCEAMRGGHTYADLLVVAAEFAPLAARDGVREAVVLPTDPVSDAAIRFWQTAAENRGLSVRVFPAREEALAWLQSP
jgi:hypothetical protein